MNLISPPEIEPLLFDDVVVHLRMGTAEIEAERSNIEALISVARIEAENYTGRALISQTWEMKLHCLAYPIRLPKQRVQSIESITYIDLDGNPQTLPADQYRLSGWDSNNLLPAYAVNWPSSRGDIDSVTVRWVVGYGDDGGDVPMPIRQWMLIRIGTLYIHREEVVTGSIVTPVKTLESLLHPYQVHEV